MSSARITIGGLDVTPHPGESVAGTLPVAESQPTAGVDRMSDGGHAPVILTVEHTPRKHCPLPLLPRRILSIVVVLGLIFSLVAILSERRRRAG